VIRGEICLKFLREEGENLQSKAQHSGKICEKLRKILQICEKVRGFFAKVAGNFAFFCSFLHPLRE
jgi:hypothetical protein